MSDFLDEMNTAEITREEISAVLGDAGNAVSEKAKDAGDASKGLASRVMTALKENQQKEYPEEAPLIAFEGNDKEFTSVSEAALAAGQSIRAAGGAAKDAVTSRLGGSQVSAEEVLQQGELTVGQENALFAEIEQSFSKGIARQDILSLTDVVNQAREDANLPTYQEWEVAQTLREVAAGVEPSINNVIDAELFNEPKMPMLVEAASQDKGFMERSGYGRDDDGFMAENKPQADALFASWTAGKDPMQSAIDKMQEPLPYQGQDNPNMFERGVAKAKNFIKDNLAPQEQSADEIFSAMDEEGFEFDSGLSSHSTTSVGTGMSR